MNEEALKDIKDIYIFSSSLVWLWVLVAILVLGAGLFFILRRKKKEAPQRRDPRGKALKYLSELRNSKRSLTEQALEASQIIKTFIEEFFGAPATDRTVEELEVVLRKINLNEKGYTDCLRFLRDLEGAKFGNRHFTEREKDKLLDEMVQWLESV